MTNSNSANMINQPSLYYSIHTSGTGGCGACVQPNWTFSTVSSPMFGTLVKLMDARGRVIDFEVDPSMLNLITLVNTTHATIRGMVAPINPYIPSSSTPAKFLPEEDFTLDELAKAEELMEELGAS